MLSNRMLMALSVISACRKACMVMRRWRLVKVDFTCSSSVQEEGAGEDTLRMTKSVPLVGIQVFWEIGGVDVLSPLHSLSSNNCEKSSNREGMREGENQRGRSEERGEVRG